MDANSASVSDGTPNRGVGEPRAARAAARASALRMLRPPMLPPAARYAAAAASILAIFAIQRTVLPAPGVAPFVLLFAGVAIAAWFGGIVPGILGTLLAAGLGNYFFIPPQTAFNLEGAGLTATLAFLVSGTTAAFLCGSLRAAMREADTRAAQLRALLEEQKESQRELRYAKANMDRAQKIAHLGSWELDLLANRLSWSDEVYRIFGIAPQSFGASYEAFLEAVHPDDRAAVDAAYSGSLREGRSSYEIEHRVVRRGTGEVRVVQERCEHLRDETGRVVRSAGMVLDITDRKRTEDALSERKNRLDLAMRAAGIGAWDWDIAEDRRTFDDQVCALLGIDPARFTGTAKEFFAAVHPDDWPRLNEAMARTVKDDAPYTPEYRAVWPDGSVHDVVAAGRLLRSESGRPRRIIGVLFDVTERKRLVEALREADRRKNEFLGVLSHELRNPLTPIRNCLHLLARVPPGSEQAKRAQAVIERQVAHLARLVDDLLDVTRITRGKVDLQRERIDLVELVRKTGEDYRSVLAERQYELQVPGEPVFIDADATRLAQAFGNLLSNAAKFTPADGKVVVSLTRTEKQAVLTVTDTGVGIDAETRARLFEPFAQGDRSLDRSRGGLGLGLALVKGMIALHGGEVGVESAGPGTGARLTITLPLRKSAPSAQTQPATASPAR